MVDVRLRCRIEEWTGRYAGIEIENKTQTYIFLQIDIYQL